ncbi:hypothetical protein AQUCO_02000550v1 [Aquilegia coerulea]|uniref:Myb/SANT-like DNA-binding domain-containing protein n=1 Tax=Aquilegia coerulea TaxID=218851 RepID=A0A2G5DI60_AQUCA|nr:hypothetical protein AQUCO_02000550v1 [Aquilegia coerulea]
MEDEEEIQQTKALAAIPNQNGGRFLMTAQPVTVATPPPPQNILTLALPIQQPRTTHGGSGSGSGGGGGGGREDCWSEGATSTLIDAWGERYLELSRGNLKQKHWRDVADIVSSREDYNKPAKTDVQCKNRIDTLKKKYKIEVAKIASGQGPSKWNFFHRLDRLIGPNAKNPASAVRVNAGMPMTPMTNAKIPVGIPVGVPLRKSQQQQYGQQRRKQQYQRPGSIDSNSSSEPPPSPDSTDSLPPENTNRKKPRFERKLNSDPLKTDSGNLRKNAGWGNSMKELSRAILEFGEAYERIETSKLQQTVEMEKQRIGFAKELELQRMQFLMNTQLELTQLKHGKKLDSSNHHHNNNNRNRSN